MKIEELLDFGRKVWRPRVGKMTLDEIIIAMGVVFGDLCRVARDFSVKEMMRTKPNALPEEPYELQLQKELGNMIVSAIRWADDLGFDVDECIDLAVSSQLRFAQTRYGAILPHDRR